MTSWQGKSVLVAGGAGFVGHHLMAALLNAHATIHVVDNLSTGQAIHLEKLQTRFDNQVHLQIHDVCVPSELPECDVLYNLASPASPLHYQADPIGTWKTNTLGTLNLLEHAQRIGARFVQASTSEVYGNPITHPQSETDWGNVNPIGPRACYDESKRAAESLLMDAVRVAHADVRIARIFNTYGTGMQAGDGRAIPNFIAQAEMGKPLTVFGDGSQTRSFCHVDDTVDGLLRMGMSPAARGEVINIGNPHEVTLRALADQINALWENASHIDFHPIPVDDPMRRRPDISKARRLLDWEPKISLSEGLEMMHKASIV